MNERNWKLYRGFKQENKLLPATVAHKCHTESDFFYRVSDFFGHSVAHGWLLSRHSRLETVSMGDTERADMIFCVRTACLHSKFCDESPSCTYLNRAVSCNAPKFFVSSLFNIHGLGHGQWRKERILKNRGCVCAGCWIRRSPVAV